MLEIIGEVEGKNALIVDDFSISGGTLINLAKNLKDRGAKKIIAALSHNILSAKGVERIEASPIDMVISTDTVFNANTKDHPRFKTLSVAPIFAESIKRYHNYGSLNDLSYLLPEDLFKACAADVDED